MTPLVKTLLTFIGIGVVFTFTLAGFGLWKVYSLNSIAFYITFGLYILSFIITGYLVYRFLYHLKLDVSALVKKIKKVADQILKELEVLTTNPIALLKAIKKILGLLKPKPKK